MPPARKSSRPHKPNRKRDLPHDESPERGNQTKGAKKSKGDGSGSQDREGVLGDLVAQMQAMQKAIAGLAQGGNPAQGRPGSVQGEAQGQKGGVGEQVPGPSSAKATSNVTLGGTHQVIDGGSQTVDNPAGSEQNVGIGVGFPQVQQGGTGGGPPHTDPLTFDLTEKLRQEIAADLAQSRQRECNASQQRRGNSVRETTRGLSLTAAADVDLKQLIWSEAYVELGFLRQKAAQVVSYDQKSREKVKEVTSPHEWRSLFAAYAAILLQERPDYGPDLFAYQENIMMLSAHYGGFVWRDYDIIFRRCRAQDPSLSWGAIIWDKVLRLGGDPAANPAAKNNWSPFQGAKQFKPAGSGFCYAYNRGSCNKRECPYPHVCGSCGQAGHGKPTCKRANAAAGAPSKPKSA